MVFGFEEGRVTFAFLWEQFKISGVVVSKVKDMFLVDQ